MRDQHTEHCCKEHGCKYNAENRDFDPCTVTSGEEEQSFPCEECELADDTIMKPLYNYGGRQTEVSLADARDMVEDKPSPTDTLLLTDIAEMLSRPRRLEDGEVKRMKRRIWERLKYVQPGD
jgi:hypothetical protein